MTRDEIIRDIEERAYGAGAGQYMSLRCDVAREIARMLKAQEPRVMTREEMIEAGKEHRAVFVEENPRGYAKCFWGIAVEGDDAPSDRPFNYPGGVDFNVIDADLDVLDGDFYAYNGVLSWRCWTARPTPEQMRETKWEVEDNDRN